ncbi:MAG TPA: tubulin-like doman-containing protein, partial [Acidobacteriota bacterium]|nr:tubulin-like doman-containing protein [Acidobacteriota bacterium]
MRSAIILMLGGTGLEVGAMTRRMIVERYGHLRELPIITYLHLDTALEDASLTPAKVLGVDLSLVSQERIRLEMPSFSDGGVSYLAQHPEIKEWFPSNLRIEHDFSLGAGAVRPYGRIAFAQNAAKIEQALHDCARRVNSNDVRTQVSQRWDPVENGIDVYIVCSLLGGTGGGTFLDAAYLARHVVSRYTPDVQILGYLVIGAGSSIKETPNLANCYSALKELNYYTTQAQIAKGNINSPFSVEYPGMPFRIESGSVPPFDFCYLVTNFNEENVELQKPELFELTAQNIFLEFTPGVSSDKRAIRNNIVEHKFRELEQQLGQAQSYLTFGIATIEYPAARVQDCLAYRLAGETVAYLPFYTAPVDPSIPQEAKADLKRWVLDDEQLVASLITGDGGKRITTVIAEQKDQGSAQFQNYLGRPS